MTILDRPTLKEAGMEFDENVTRFPLPTGDDDEEFGKECTQARILRNYLLNFWKTIRKEDVAEFDEQEQQHFAKQRKYMLLPEQPDPKKAPLRYAKFNKAYDAERCRQNVCLAARIANSAKSIQTKDEQRWSTLIQSTFLSEYMEMSREAEESTRKKSAQHVLNRFTVEKEHQWFFGKEVLHQYCQLSNKSRNGFRNSSYKQLKAPKPDLYFSFYAHGKGDSEGGPLHTDDYIYNFSLDQLCSLSEFYTDDLCRRDHHHKYGFYPSPLKDFLGLSSDDHKNRACFPWAVCEWKHHGISPKQQEYLYCQAANAAAVCLTIFANAASGGYTIPRLDEVRPVVCFTFAGPRCRVWMAYVSSARKGFYKYRMNCIWAGNLKNMVDNVKLCVILQRLHFWAINHLRPWLSSCVDQWRRTKAEYDAESGDEDDEDSEFVLRRVDTLEQQLEHSSSESEDESNQEDVSDSEGVDEEDSGSDGELNDDERE